MDMIVVENTELDRLWQLAKGAREDRVRCAIQLRQLEEKELRAVNDMANYVKSMKVDGKMRTGS